MADIVMLTQIIAQNNEQNSNSPTPTTPSSSGITENISVYKNEISVIGVLIGIYAAYLSWECNTAQGVSTGLKVLYAIFAYLFGFLYLVYYFLFRSDVCKQSIKSMTGGNSSPGVGTAQFYYF